MIVNNIHVPKEIAYDSRRPYNGVFSYLQNCTKTTRICYSGYISATAVSSHVNTPEFPLVTKDEANTYFRSYANSNLWFLVDFKNYFFVLKRYTYRTFYCDFFEEWRMMGSNDGLNFKTIHHQKNYQKPSEQFHTENFKATVIRPFRYFKIVPVGKTVCSNAFIAIHRLDFFGTLHSKESMLRLRMSCMIHRIHLKVLLSLIQAICCS